MITVRKSESRGLFRTDWLESRHTFSFDTYHDPDHMGYRTLRVINEDWVQPGNGFPLHPHHDMEIVTFVIEGILEHRDDLGNRETIRAGEVQRITAGAGIRHSEGNPSEKDAVHLLQIWIFPEAKGLAPDYEKKSFASLPSNTLNLLVSRDGRNGSAVLRQDAAIYYGSLGAGRTLESPVTTGRHGWLQLVEGALTVNGSVLKSGDGAAIDGETTLNFSADEDSHFVLFDLS